MKSNKRIFLLVEATFLIFMHLIIKPFVVPSVKQENQKIKYMRLLRFAVVGFCLMGMTAFGQEEAKTPEKRAEVRINKLDEQVDLTDKQKEKLQALSVDFITSQQKIKADETITDEVKKSQIKELRQKHKEAVKEILTEEQIAKLEEIRKQKKEEKRKKTLEEKMRAKTDMMSEKLELSEEQDEKLYVLNVKVAQKIKAIKEDPDMTDAKKKEFIKGNKEDYMRVLGTILTEDQMKKFETWKAEKKAKHKEEHDKPEEKSEE
jgi:hypothetical protein